jgi:hypothetical protein
MQNPLLKAGGPGFINRLWCTCIPGSPLGYPRYSVKGGYFRCVHGAHVGYYHNRVGGRGWVGGRVGGRLGDSVHMYLVWGAVSVWVIGLLCCVPACVSLDGGCPCGWVGACEHLVSLHERT